MKPHLTMLECLCCLLQLAQKGCSKEQLERVHALAADSSDSSTPLYRRQHLFSVYVHASTTHRQKYERDRCVRVCTVAATMQGAGRRG